MRRQKEAKRIRKMSERKEEAYSADFQLRRRAATASFLSLPARSSGVRP